MLPKAKTNHEFLNATNQSGWLLHQNKGESITHEKPDQQDIRQFPTRRSHHWSIIVSAIK